MVVTFHLTHPTKEWFEYLKWQSPHFVVADDHPTSLSIHWGAPTLVPLYILDQDCQEIKSTYCLPALFLSTRSNLNFV